MDEKAAAYLLGSHVVQASFALQGTQPHLDRAKITLVRIQLLLEFHELLGRRLVQLPRLLLLDDGRVLLGLQGLELLHGDLTARLDDQRGLQGGLGVVEPLELRLRRGQAEVALEEARVLRDRQQRVFEGGLEVLQEGMAGTAGGQSKGAERSGGDSPAIGVEHSVGRVQTNSF